MTAARIDARDGECRHGMLPGQCAPCKGADLPDVDDEPRAKAPHPAAWWHARYPDRCQGCGAHIVPGDLITRADHGYLAECCAEAAL